MYIVFSSIAMFLVLIIFTLMIIMKKNATKRAITANFHRCGKHADDLDKLGECIFNVLLQLNKYIVDVGIYAQTSNAYTRKSGAVEILDESNILKNNLNDKKVPKIPDMVYNINVKKYGRYRLYNIEEEGMAFLILSKTKLNLDPYRSVLQLLLKEAGMLKTVMDYKNKLELLDVRYRTSDFFMAFSSDKEFTVAFIEKLAKTITQATYIEVFWENEVYKSGNPTNEFCREFYARGTGLRLKVCGVELAGSKIEELGKMLDMLSYIIMKESVVVNYLNILSNLVKISENKSDYYKNHSQIVKTISVMLASHMGLSDEEIKVVEHASLLHDIGSMEEISGMLIKKEQLTETEYKKVKYHPIVGASIVYPINELYSISKPILQHHEFIDGTGYPYGLTDEDILTESKIICCAEVYAGLISSRPYRKGYSYEEALDIIKAEFENKIANDVILALNSIHDEIMDELEKLNKT
jgi:HD-GYP domain-containing protein (c-di-GMP phosphodiesterase class II)